MKRRRRRAATEKVVRRRWRKIGSPDQVLTRGHTKKWNLTCSCPMCRKARFKDKGYLKRRREAGA